MRSSLFTALVLLARSVAASPQATVSLDAHASASPLSHLWSSCLGSGHAALTLREDWRPTEPSAASQRGQTGPRREWWNMAPAAPPAAFEAAEAELTAELRATSLRTPSSVNLPQFPLPESAPHEREHRMREYLQACSRVLSANREPAPNTWGALGAPPRGAGDGLGEGLCGGEEPVVIELEELRRQHVGDHPCLCELGEVGEVG